MLVGHTLVIRYNDYSVQPIKATRAKRGQRD